MLGQNQTPEGPGKGSASQTHNLGEGSCEPPGMIPAPFFIFSDTDQKSFPASAALMGNHGLGGEGLGAPFSPEANRQLSSSLALKKRTRMP